MVGAGLTEGQTVAEHMAREGLSANPFEQHQAPAPNGRMKERARFQLPDLSRSVADNFFTNIDATLTRP